MKGTSVTGVPGLVATLIVIVGCGGGGGGMEDPDAASGGPDAAGSAPDAAAQPDGAVADDTTPPVIVASAPADGEHPVSVLTDIVITFDEALDPATATAPGVTLSLAGTITPLHGAVSYDDAAHAITFHTTYALIWNSEYVVTLTGIADPSGNTMATETLRFHTFRNSIVRTVNYAAGGAVSSWSEATLDVDGDLATFTSHKSDPGPDGVSLTNDDAIVHWRAYERDAGRRIVRMVTYLGVGPDGVWKSDDDVVIAHQDRSYDLEGRVVRVTTFSKAGADGVWMTDDDLVSGYEDHAHDATGSPSRLAYFNGVGPDGLWFTADDAVGGYYTYLNDALGRQIMRLYVPGYGPDLLWFTADDHIAERLARVYDAEGRLASYFASVGPGADGVGGSLDDDITWYYQFVYNAAGILLHELACGDPGGDVAWHTSDDVFWSDTEYSDFVAKDLSARKTSFDGAGAIMNHTNRAFDAEGNRVTETWFDADNHVGWEFDYDTTR